MNFAYGVIVIVGVLAAIILGLIALEPDGIVEPRIVPVEEKPSVCTMQWEPMCGVDGETYGNLCMLDAVDVKLDYEGECVIAQSEPESEAEHSMEEIVEEVTVEETVEISAVESEPDVETLPMALTISIPEGVGVPGCEETRECFSPYEVSVAVGATVTWSNDDIAVHTVTSGKAMLHDELFDSSIFMSGDTFETTFNDAGSFDYFCIVHAWMTGIVHVS